MVRTGAAVGERASPAVGLARDTADTAVGDEAAGDGTSPIAVLVGEVAVGDSVGQDPALGTTLLMGAELGSAVMDRGGTGEVVAISATVVGVLHLAVPDAAMVFVGNEVADPATASHAGMAEAISVGGIGSVHPGTTAGLSN